MTIQVIESWKTYAATANITRRWVYQQGNGGSLQSNGCLLNGSVVSYCNTHINQLHNLRMGFWFTPVQRAPSVTNSSSLHLLQGGETNLANQIGLGHNTNGTMSCFRGSNFTGLGGTTLANGTTVLSLNTAYWLELNVLFHPTAGTVELRINGTTEFSLTGINTSPISGHGIERVALVAGASAQYLYGGMYIGDGAEGWLGPCNVERLALTADTAQKDFTPSTGASNFALLNDLDNHTTYVSSGNLSATDLYTIAAPSYTPASIKAVQVLAEAIQTDAANLVHAVVPVMKSGSSSQGIVGAVVPQAAFPLTWQTEARGVSTTAPDGSAWTYSNVASLRVGFRTAPFGKGFNFRATAGHVTDAAYNTYVIGDLYPTTRGGVTFGWSSAPTTFDLTATSDVYAGVNYQSNNGTQRTFRVDLPTAGRYQLRLLNGKNGNPLVQSYIQVKDGSTPLFTIDTTTDPNFDSTAGGIDAAGSYLINGTTTAAASWAEYNTPRVITMTGTVLNITIGSPSSGTNWTFLGHLEVVALDQVNALTSVAPTVETSGLFVEALMSATASSNAISVTQGTPTVVQSGTVTISNGYLLATALGDTDSQVTFTVGTPPSHGTLKKSGSSTSSFTQADVDNGLITYVQNGDAVVSDSFVFTVSATGATTTGNLTFHITITPTVVTAPIVFVANPLIVARNGAEVLFNGYLLATATAVADTAITYTVTTPPAYGTLIMGGNTVTTFTQANLDSGLVGYTQNGTNVAFDQFTVAISSSGLTSLTGQVFGIFIEDLGFHFSSAAVGTCPTTVVDDDCETATVAADCETSDLPGCCA